MMKSIMRFVFIGSGLAIMGCTPLNEFTEATYRSGERNPNLYRAVGEDFGRDNRTILDMEAGIYIDPDGCHVWMVDDGAEGFWSRRHDPATGRPVCTPIAPPNAIVGSIDNQGRGLVDRVPPQ
jgi:hypothetical protein